MYRFAEEHHTYEEVCKFANALDNDVEVYEKYNDTLKKEGSIEYSYREWSAVINGIKCHVASAPDTVWNEDFAAGEFGKRYYRIDTDYDYYLLEQLLSEKKPEWKLEYSENDIMSRYNWNCILSVSTSYIKSDRLTDAELEIFWQECVEINSLYHTFPVNDRLMFEIHAPYKCYDFQTEKYYIDIDCILYADDFSEQGEQEFFKEYNECWDLLNSDTPINESN